MLNDLLDLNQVLLLPELEFAIEDLLPRGGILVIGGDPKFGKSVIVLDLLLRGVQGQNAFCKFRQTYKKVLLVNIEGRHQGIKMRDMMYKQMPEAVRAQIVVSGRPIRFTLPNGTINPIAYGALRKAIDENHVELVVMDPLVSFHTGDENNSQQMVAMLDELRSVGDDTKCAFVIIHHTRKMGSMQTLEQAIEQGGNMLRGASGIFGAVDSLALVWKVDHGVRRLVTFACRYARGDTDPIEMQMDKKTWRMYPVIGDVGNKHPDPEAWFRDNERNWVGYASAFGIDPQVVETYK